MSLSLNYLREVHHSNLKSHIPDASASETDTSASLAVTCYTRNTIQMKFLLIIDVEKPEKSTRLTFVSAPISFQEP